MQDEERRRWVETLLAACERVLEDHERLARDDPGFAIIRADAESLRDRLRRELDGFSRPA